MILLEAEKIGETLEKVRNESCINLTEAISGKIEVDYELFDTIYTATKNAVESVLFDDSIRFQPLEYIEVGEFVSEALDPIIEQIKSGNKDDKPLKALTEEIRASLDCLIRALITTINNECESSEVESNLYKNIDFDVFERVIGGRKAKGRVFTMARLFRTAGILTNDNLKEFYETATNLVEENKGMKGLKTAFINAVKGRPKAFVYPKNGITGKQLGLINKYLKEKFPEEEFKSV